MALAIDASTPAIVVGPATSGTTIASNAFTPPTGSLVVVIALNAVSIANVTSIAGGSLTYTSRSALAVNANSVSIWTAPVGASPGSMTSTITLSASIGNRSGAAVAVIVVTGQDPSPIGAQNTASAASAGTPSCTIASLTGTNSLVLAGVLNWTNGTLPTIPGGQSDVFNGLTQAVTTAAASGLWAQYLTGMNLSAGSSATINDTAPTGIRFTECMLEILALAATPGIPDLTVAPMHR